MKKTSPFPAIGIIMLGIVMRSPFTALPTILTDIASTFGVSVGELGLLTSIPLLMFAFLSSLAPYLSRKFGMEGLLTLVLSTLFVGSLIRVVNLPSLYLGTVLVGGAIAMINVLLPSFVSRHYPNRIGFYTTVYVTIMALTASLVSLLAVPIVSVTSWQTFILLLSGVILLALVLWLPNLTLNSKENEVNLTSTSSSPWRNRGAQYFLLFGGLQSLLFYTEIAWLPTIVQTAGLSKGAAGTLIGIYSFISIPVSMVTPEMVTRLTVTQRQMLMAAASGLTLIGLLLILLVPAQFGWWLLIHLLLGLSTGTLFPYMMVSFSLKTSSSQATAQLSGMVQTGGYLIAALGPVLLGYSYILFSSWLPFIFSLFFLTVVMIWTIYKIEQEQTIL